MATSLLDDLKEIQSGSSSSLLDDLRDIQSSNKKSTERTWGEAFSDTGKQLGSSVARAYKSAAEAAEAPLETATGVALGLGDVITTGGARALSGISEGLGSVADAAGMNNYAQALRDQASYLDEGVKQVRDITGYNDAARIVAQRAAEVRKKSRDEDSIASQVASGAGMVKKELEESQSAKARQMREDRHRAEGFTGTIKHFWDNPTDLVAFGAENAPDTAIGMVPAIGVGMFGRVAAKEAAAVALADSAKRKLSAEATKAAVTSAAKQQIDRYTKAATAVGITTESLQSGLITASEIRDKVMKAKEEDLRNNAMYQDLRLRGASSEEAKATMSERLANEYATLSALATAAGSHFTGGARATAELGSGAGKATVKETGKRIGKEVQEEVAQGVGEDYAQYSAERQVDPNAKFDLGKSIALNAIGGATMAGPMHGTGYALSKMGEKTDAAKADVRDLTSEFDQANAAWRALDPKRQEQLRSGTDAEVALHAKQNADPAVREAASFELQLREQNKSRQEMIDRTMAADQDQANVESRPFADMTDSKLASGISSIEWAMRQAGPAAQLTDEQDRILARATYELGQRKAEAQAAQDHNRTLTLAAADQSLARLAALRSDESSTQPEISHGQELQGQAPTQALEIAPSATARTNTVGEALRILQTPAAQRVPADQFKLRNVQQRIGPEAFSLLEQAARGPFALTREQQTTVRQMIDADAVPVAPTPKNTSSTLPQTTRELQLADNEAGQFSTARDDQATLRNLSPELLAEEDAAGLSAEPTNTPTPTVSTTPGAMYATQASQTQQGQSRTAQQTITDSVANSEYAGSNLTLVEPSGLKLIGKGYTRGVHSLMERVAKAFDKRIVLYRGDPVMVNGKLTPPPDGFINRGIDSGVIFLNANSQINALSVFGHELMHHLAAEMPTAFLAVAQQVGMSQKAIDNYLKFYAEGEVKSEFISDLAGDLFVQPEFWSGVFQRIADAEGAAAKPIIERLRDVVVRMINTIVGHIQANNYGTKQFIDPAKMREVKAAIQQAFAEYMAAVQRGDTRQDATGGMQTTQTSKSAEERKGRTLDEVRSRVGNDHKLTVSSDPRHTVDGKSFETLDSDNYGPGLLLSGDYQAEMRKMMREAAEESLLPQELYEQIKIPTLAFMDKAFTLADGARFWYELSAEGFGGGWVKLKPARTEHLIDIVAGTSGGQKPTDNMRVALAAMAQETQNQPVTVGVRDAASLTGALSPEALQTHKFGNFADTMQLLAGLRPGVEPLPTIDLQMSAVFGIKHAAVASNPVMYETLSRFLIKLRDAQNAALPEGAQPYESWQIQALLWVQQRATSDPDSYNTGMPKIVKQLQDAGIPTPGGKITEATLKDPRTPALLAPSGKFTSEAHTATIETRTLLTEVGRSSTESYNALQGVPGAWANKLRKEFVAIQRRTMKALGERISVPGRETRIPSIIGQLMGWATDKGVSWGASRVDTNGTGTFAGVASPNLRVPMLVSTSGGKTFEDRNQLLTPDQRRFVLAVIGKAFRQEAMAASQFVPAKPGDHHTFSVLVKDYSKSDISEEQLAKISEILDRPVNYSRVPNGWRIDINVGGFENVTDANEVKAATDKVFGKQADVLAIPQSYDSDYLSLDPTETDNYDDIIKDFVKEKFNGLQNRDGRGVGKRGRSAGSYYSDLARIRQALRGIAARQEQAFADWDKQARAELEKRGISFSVAREGPDATSDRPAGEGVASESLPRYGRPADRHAVSVTGVHYSREQRPTLSSRYFGTGMKGQERLRVAEATDPRIKRRLYFYANTGRGISPESDVGTHAHTTGLDNVYDMDVDPLRLYVQPTPDSPYRSPDNRMNDFESAVLDAGYDGYMTREFGQGGAVVLLGDHSVPVQYEGSNVRPEVDATPAPRYSDLQQLKQRIQANRALPAGQMTGLEWKRLLMREMPEVDPRWLENDTLYRKGDLLRGAEDAGVQHSKSRFQTPEFKEWFAESEITNEDGSPRIYYHGTARDIGTFQPKQAQAIFVSPDPEFAEDFAHTSAEWKAKNKVKDGVGQNIMPVVVRAENPFDPDSKADVEAMRLALGGSWGEGASKVSIRHIADGSWSALEHPITQAYIKANHDSFYVYEGGRKNLAVFDPNQIKSASGNNGQYSRRNPDVRYSPGRQPWYYSQLEDGVRSARIKTQPATQWALWMKSQGFKKDELEWSGVMDYLALRGKDRITSDELGDWLKQNNVQVNDVVLGEIEAITGQEVADDMLPAGYRVRQTRFGIEIKSGAYTIGTFDTYDEAADAINEDTESNPKTKFSSYVLPGGTGYKELLITLPEKYTYPQAKPLTESERIRAALLTQKMRKEGNLPAEEMDEWKRLHNTSRIYTDELDSLKAQGKNQDPFQSSHFDQPNILAHVRMNERVDSEGRRVLFLEEIQSDYAQKGRKEGFNSTKAARMTGDVFQQQDSNYWGVRWVDGDILGWYDRATAERIAAAGKPNSTQSVPAAPFVTDTKAWVALALKRSIAYAVENGFSRVAWTTGEQQAARYDLSKQIKAIEYEKQPDGRYHVFAITNTGDSRLGDMYSDDQLEEVVGKDVAKKIVAGEGDSSEGNGYKELSGLDLKVGGEGMKGFYDQIVPQVAKKLGVEVGSVDIGSGGKRQVVMPNGMIHPTKMESITTRQPGFTIPESIRQQVAERGMPLFSRSRELTNWAQLVMDGKRKEAAGAKMIIEKPTGALNIAGIFRPIVMDVFHVVHILNTHGEIHPADIGRLPDLLASPRAVISRPDGWRVIVDRRDEQSRPMAVGLTNTKSGEIKITTIDTLFGMDDSAEEVVQALLAGKVTYMPEREIDRVRGLIDVATQPSEDLRSGPRLPLQAGNSPLPTHLNSGLEVTIPTDNRQVKKLTLPKNAPALLKGVAFSAARDEPSKMDNFLRVMQDRHIDLKRVTNAIKAQSGNIDERWNAYLSEELFHGKAAKGVKSFLDQELRPLIQDLSLKGLKLDQFEEYLWYRHAKERNAQIAKINPKMPDGGSGKTNQEVEAYFVALAPEQRRLMELVAQRVDEINAKTLDTLVEYGLEKQGTIDAMRKAYQNYVPLHRDDTDNHLFGGNGTGKGFNVRGASTKRAMGSAKGVENILANIAMQRERAIVRGEKNRVAQSMYGLALTHPNEMWKAIAPSKLSPKQIEQMLIDMGANPLDAKNMASAPTEQWVNPRTGMVETRVNPLWASAPNVLTLRVNGEDRHVAFNAENERAAHIVTALKNLDADQLGRVMQWFGKITRWFASINTQYNPIFGVTNIARDTGGLLVNLSTTPLRYNKLEVLKQIGPAWLGIYGDLRAHRDGRAKDSEWAQWYERFENVGGQTGYRDQFNNADERMHDIQKEFTKAGQGKTMAAGRATLDWLSDYNETMENATRLAVFKTGIDNGLSDSEAASLAKNITVNFNRKGTVATQAGALYAFFNASAQGTARMAETMTGPAGRKIAFGGVMLGVMNAALLAMAGFGDDEPPDFVRERNIVLPIGGKRYLTWPMPLGFHILPNIGRVATEIVLGGGKDAGKKMAGLLGSVFEAFNPIGSAGWSVQTIAPTFADPLVALAENKDWTGKKIAKEDFNTLDPSPGHARAKDTATVWSRKMSEAINWITGGTEFKKGILSPTPDQIDYLIGQVTGGVGREVGKVAQIVESAKTGEELPAHKIPLVGRFYGNSEGAVKESARFYKMIEELNGHERQIKGLREAKRAEEALKYIEANPEARLVASANAAAYQVRQLQKQKRDMIKADRSREMVKLKEQQITQAMKQFNDRVAEQALR